MYDDSEWNETPKSYLIVDAEEIHVIFGVFDECFCHFCMLLHHFLKHLAIGLLSIFLGRGSFFSCLNSSTCKGLVNKNPLSLSDWAKYTKIYFQKRDRIKHTGHERLDDKYVKCQVDTESPVLEPTGLH